MDNIRRRKIWGKNITTNQLPSIYVGINLSATTKSLRYKLPYVQVEAEESDEVFDRIRINQQIFTWNCSYKSEKTVETGWGLHSLMLSVNYLQCDLKQVEQAGPYCPLTLGNQRLFQKRTPYWEETGKESKLSRKWGKQRIKLWE